MTSKIQQAISNRRRPHYEVERENYEKDMAMHITKAISKEEGATKEKHVRTILMGTFKDGNARLFWNIVLRMSLQGHPIVCWKFFHVLHKILREGHHACLAEAVAHRVLLGELAKLWGHLKDGYGRPIQAFSKLIIAKLKFHQKYAQVPGTLNFSNDLVAQIAQNAVDSYFELSIDLLDYLDELLGFQLAVFSSLDRSKANSMTLHGQCKLSPLIQCLQDSAALYDTLVNILFRLHAHLPADTLTGHTERFLKGFRELKTFYQTCSNLQYYKNLVTVPQLPDEAPDFLLAGGLSQHRTPVVNTVSPVDDDVEDDYDDKEDPQTWVPEHAAMRTAGAGALLDFSADEAPPVSDPFFSTNSPATFTAFEPPVNGLQESSTLLNEGKVRELNSRIQELEKRMEQLQKEKQDLDKKLQENVDLQLKDKEDLSAYKQKFSKLKEIYQKLREEHIALLRKHAAANKELVELRQQLEASQKSLSEQRNQIAHLHDLRDIAEGSGGSSQSPAALEAELKDARRRREELEAALDSAEAERAALKGSAAEAQAKADSLAQENFSLSESLRLAEERTHSEEAKNDSLAKQQQAANQQIEETRKALIARACHAGVEQIKDTLELFEDPALISCRSNADFLLGRVDALLSEVEGLEEACQLYLTQPEAVHDVLAHIHAFVARTRETVLQGRIVSNAAPHVDLTEELQSLSRITAEEGCTFLTNLSDGWDEETLIGHCASLFNHLSGLRALADVLRPQVRDVKPEDMGELVEAEMRGISEAVEAAEARVRDLIERAQGDLTGVRLEVNMSVLESCTTLMLAVKALVTRAGHLQREIVAEGRGASSSAEFYQKHSRWTDGLLSAAKAVGLGATTLCDSADKIVSSGSCRFEEVMVCAQEIVASTAQLVVASRVKANPKSYLLQQLGEVSRQVTQATGAVVAQARAGGDRVQDEEAQDFSKLSLTQTKRQEMQAQVRVLELESALARERVALGELRKQHYRLSAEEGDVIDEDQPSSTTAAS